MLLATGLPLTNGEMHPQVEPEALTDHGAMGEACIPRIYTDRGIVYLIIKNITSNIWSNML